MMRRWLGTGLVLLAAVPVGLVLHERERDLDGSRAVVAQLNADIEALSDEVTRLDSWSEALRTDAEAMERVARERMGYVREGEWVFRMESDAAGAEDSAPKPR